MKPGFLHQLMHLLAVVPAGEDYRNVHRNFYLCRAPYKKKISSLVMIVSKHPEFQVVR